MVDIDIKAEEYADNYEMTVVVVHHKSDGTEGSVKEVAAVELLQARLKRTRSKSGCWRF